MVPKQNGSKAMGWGFDEGGLWHISEVPVCPTRSSTWNNVIANQAVQTIWGQKLK
jgi:hypothetical protein